MNMNNDIYNDAAKRIEEEFEGNRELIINKKGQYLNGGLEDISEEFKSRFGYEVLEKLSDQEKLKRMVWINGGTNSLFYEITLGKYRNQGSVVMGNGPYSYLARFDPEHETYSIGNQWHKNKKVDESEVLEEINNFIKGLKDAEKLIRQLTEYSSVEDYRDVYQAVLERISNNSMKIILNKYFSLLYPNKWSKFIGKEYGCGAVKKLLDIEVNEFESAQYYLMKIQSILTSNTQMTPYEFMLTYDELINQIDKGDLAMNRAEYHEEGFKEWIKQYKILKNKRPESWIAPDAKINWLRGYTEEDSFNQRVKLMPVKDLYLKIDGLSKSETELLNQLPSNLFSLSKDDFIKAHTSIKNIGKKYRKDLNLIIEESNLAGNIDATYNLFKRTTFADEYMTYLSEEYDIKEKSKYTQKLKASKNIIFRGAPGTGKTYLARQVASEIISKGRTFDFEELTDDEKERFEFVQFHPSYDYTDFIEGYRPINDTENHIGFKLVPGIFKKFLTRAINSRHIGGQDNFDESWDKFFEKVNESMLEDGDKGYEMKSLTGAAMNLKPYERGGMEGVSEKKTGTMYFNKNQCYNVYQGLPGVPKRGLDSYRKAIIEHLKEKYGLLDYIPQQSMADGSPHVFVIDEINRGEISKIFGELFFAIDPGYRGEKGAVQTQYSSLGETDEKLYVPENVYIIGTMNDIDRSVENFDFAMRRRFRFIEIKADDEEQLKMLNCPGINEKAVDYLKRLNQAISETENLNHHYHVGPSYFLKLEELNNDFELLWDDFLEPLLEEYVRGFFDETEILKKLKDAYNGTEQSEIDQDEFNEDGR